MMKKIFPFGLLVLLVAGCHRRRPAEGSVADAVVAQAYTDQCNMTGQVTPLH